MSAEVEQIKDRLDVAEVLGDYITLKQAGRHFKALCPFHQEKTPSFVISPDKGIWHCFGCHKGGDIFSFVQEIEGLEFGQALKMLAERAGVELKGFSKESTDKRQRIFDLLDLTGRFYGEILMRQKVGEKARKYLTERGVKEETMQKFQLGYAPQSWDTLQNFLRSKGYAPQEMIEAGVVGQSERGKMYDRFRGRIIFPIRDLQGRTLAFGGRITPWHETGEEGKYVNSPETSLYQKRSVIYNLDKAKQHLRHQEPCIVVEGYMDVVMLVQSGVENVVASSGTAFTEESTKKLSRYTNRLHFAFDADTAGFMAAMAASQVALRHGFRVSALVLSPGKDPADVVLDDPENVKEVFSSPVSLTNVLLDRLKSTGAGEKREEYLKDLLPFVVQTSNPVFQGEMIQELSSALHLPESRIIQEMQTVGRDSTKSFRPQNDSTELENGFSDINLSPDQYILGILIAYPAARKGILNDVKPGFILDQESLALYNVVHGLAKEDSGFAKLSASDVLNNLPDDHKAYGEVLYRLSEERVEQSRQDAAAEAEAAIRLIKRHALERELESLQRKMTGSKGEERLKVLENFNELTEQLSRNAR